MSHTELRAMLRHVRAHWLGLGLIVVVTLAGVALDALLPWPLKLVVDNVLGNEAIPPSLGWLEALPGADTAPALLGWLAAATVILFLLRQIVTIACNYLHAGVGAHMVYGLARELFDRLQRLSLRFHARQQTGDLVRRVLTDSDALRALVLGVAQPAFAAVAALVTMIAILWQLDRTMALLALVVLPPLALLIRGFARPLQEVAYRQQNLEGELSSRAEQSLGAIAAIQAFNAEAEETERYRTVARQVLAAYQRVSRYDLGFKTSVQAVTALATAAIMALGGFHVLEGRLTVGGLLVFLSYLTALFGPLETLAQLTSAVAAAMARARRVTESLSSDEILAEPVDAPALRSAATRPLGAVELRAVVFGYEPGRPVLHGIDLRIEPGETIALVGPTGGGKSTLLSLVPRLFDPWQGELRVAGVDVRSVRLSSLRENIAIVLQEPFLLPLTIAENIAYSRPTASHDAIVAAAIAAQADGFVRDLPRGYDTVLGERGVDLSGGQRQRLAIARAILKDAPILLLDEPTAALDVATEADLIKAIETLRRGRTTLVIAHRLSTVRRADRIAVIDGGRIVECGTPAVLLSAQGRFRDLYESQLASSPRPEGEGVA